MSCRIVVVGLVLLGTATASLAGALQTGIPWTEGFLKPELGSAWKIDVAQGNAITVEHGALRIWARQNTFAHIQRALGVDLVRAQCILRPDNAISWVSSLFLYWGPNDWCQVSVLGGGTFYCVELIEGRLNEYRPGRWEGGPEYRVAVELAEDCLRYQASRDGRQWQSLRVARRPDAWRGRPPRLLILGKGFSRNEPGAKAFPEPDLDNNFTEPGGWGVSFVREVSVSSTPAPRTHATAAERSRWEREGRDILGEEELAANEDPSFASVSRHFPPMQDPREVVGVKDGPVEVGVRPDASLEVGGRWFWFEIGTPPVRFGSEPRCAKRLVDGFLPMVCAEWEREGLKCRQRVFGWSAGMRADAPLVTCWSLAISNTGNAPRTVAIRLQAQDGRERPVQTAAKWTWLLEPRSVKTLSLEIPFGGSLLAVKEAEAEQIERRFQEARSAWLGLLDQGMKLRAPEPRVNEAYRAWLAYGFLNVDKRGEIFEPHDGSGFYEEIYGYSAALYCHALDLMGFSQDAARYLESLARLVAPDGRFEVNYGMPDGGALLLAMGEHFRLSGDTAWLRKMAPTMTRMCDWIIAQRRKALAAQPPDSPFRGLLKGKPYADEATPAYSYLSDGYFVVGMESAAAAFRAAGMADEAARILKESRAYRADVMKSVARNLVVREGLKIVPMFPESHALLKRVGYTARDYYSLVAGMLLETGFFSPTDPAAGWIAKFLQRRGGLLLGMGAFGDGVDHAYTYGYWLDCLKRDQVQRVLLGFYGSLAYGMTQETYSAVEVTSLREGHNQPTLPHLYSNTQQLRLLRNMLVREEGDVLLLGQAIPRPWLEHGKQVVVDSAPTAFGKVSFTIDSRVGDRRIAVRVIPPTRQPPAAIRLRLRHPRSEPIRAVSLEGPGTCEFTGDTIVLKGLKVPLTVMARY